jgi:formylglycine-generating enzyme
MGSRRIGVVVVASLVVGCALITPLADLGGGDDGGDASFVDASDAHDEQRVEAGACGALHGPTMIIVPSLSFDEPMYCIDSTEVTESQYQDFLSAQVPLSSQPAFCAANKSFNPDLTGNCGVNAFDPANHSELPVACVDWCDAYAFCKWSGKRLCGAIGPDAGALLDQGSANIAPQDQWYNACSAKGARMYPYGASYDASACNGKASVAPLVPVGTLTGCEGGFAGIFDMSGNVAEWEDACLDASADGSVQCATRGGSVTENPGNLACTQIQNLDRGATGYNYGIRCCANL